MWLTCSSIGRKFIMALTGVCLVLFVTFHSVMNAVAIFWPASYNEVCLFLGANWYALAASACLGALIIIHIIYACWLTVQNRHARGTNRYAVSTLPPHVEWSSKNMLVLGFVILAFLVVHMIQFWAKMQLQEIISHNPADWTKVNDAAASPAMGTLYLQLAFSQWWTLPVYVLGFVALWFHMNHGFWSMFQTAGWNNRTWLPRLKTIGCWWTSIVIGLFLAEAVVFTIQANRDFYTSDVTLQEQYAEEWDAQAKVLLEEYDNHLLAIENEYKPKFEDIEKQFAKAEGEKFTELLEQNKKLREAHDNAVKDANKEFAAKAAVIFGNFEKQCPDVEYKSFSYMYIANLEMRLQQADRDWRKSYGYERPEDKAKEKEAEEAAAAEDVEVEEAIVDAYGGYDPDQAVVTPQAPVEGANPTADALDAQARTIIDAIQTQAMTVDQNMMARYGQMTQEEIQSPEVQAEIQQEIDKFNAKIKAQYGSQIKQIVNRFKAECSDVPMSSYMSVYGLDMIAQQLNL